MLHVHAFSSAHVTLQNGKFNGSASLLLSEACFHFCEFVDFYPKPMYTRLIFGEQSMLLFYLLKIYGSNLFVVNVALKCIWESKCLPLNCDETWSKYMATVSI